ncbi:MULTISPECIES: DUF3846 domain-containing protein [Thermoactinomyces]|uniref:DUF3846 domain-containing protein n=1 Tax=Thermoactinomyces daqus TaxID=1329516 RepID=A0A7W1XC68_9BACL|nr:MULTISPECIES: DUF3846 domain-containing protein [Thermoactinomyces]MBA4543977.1 DUF3846 domain-containing protein [Thermoactinomyces daqus]MBH8599090.1 DUF3846 domain-containing protein [Thermoactinomyces sp. CICC 10523]MBH8607979.1 DUF3846 domain-containing protein [Thermoactinomyces sp. CICC 10521]
MSGNQKGELVRIVVKEPFKTYQVMEVPKGNFERLREIIGCTYLDFINLGAGLTMAIDDCGKLDRKPANLKPRKPGVNDVFFGTVIS